MRLLAAHKSKGQHILKGVVSDDVVLIIITENGEGVDLEIVFGDLFHELQSTNKDQL